MPTRSAAKKTIRRDARRQIRNNRKRRVMKQTMKEVRELARAGKADEAREKLPAAQKAIDKAAKTFLHKNTASRYKSRLMNFVKKQSS